MKLALILATAATVAIALPAFAGTLVESDEQPSTQAEQAASMKQYAVCLDEAALQLDDHTSDASKTAVAVSGRCDSLRPALKAVFVRGLRQQMDSQTYLATLSKMDADLDQFAVERVLRERDFARDSAGQP